MPLLSKMYDKTQNNDLPKRQKGATQMTTRAERLAEDFEKANNELIALIEGTDEPQWRQRCAAEGWTVGVAAAHIAEDHKLLADFVQMAANGASLPDMNREGLNQYNAEMAARNEGITKVEAMGLLRNNGAAAAAVIRGLTNAQLDSAARVPDYHPVRVLEGLPERVTAQDLVQAVMITHVGEHGSSIQAAIAARANVR